MTTRKYEVGCEINGLKFIRESERSTGRSRRGIFLCPHCPNTFDSLLCAVASGIRKDCGCQPKPPPTILDKEYIQGQVINGVTFIKEVSRKRNHRMAEFTCPICNENYITYIWLVVKGRSKSCGCHSGKQTAHGHAAGERVSSEYESWCSMKYRCSQKSCDMYYAYGGRGIKVCDRWLNSFQNFMEDMGKKPTPKHSLDRIDFNGNYEPANCRWATSKQQARNTRKNVFVLYKGQSKTLMDWSEELGFPYEPVRVRIRDRGWSVEDAFTIPIFEKGKCHPGSKKEYLKGIKPKSNFISHSFGVVNKAV